MIKRKKIKLRYSRLLLCLLFCWLVGPAVWAQDITNHEPADSSRTVYSDAIYFSRNNGDWIERPEYKKTVRLLRWALSDTITPIFIIGWADSTGTKEFNDRLSFRRARAVRNYLVSKGVATQRICFEGRGIDLQAAKDDKARRADVRAVILLATEPVPVENEAEVEIEPVVQPQAEIPAKEEVQQPAVEETIAAQTQAAAEATEAAETAQLNQTSEPRTKRPLFALKTNLLFDAALTPNLEVEVPIGDRWSVMGECMFPWWLTKKHDYCLQILAGGIEGRYWLGNRKNREVLTGHFLGRYAGGGKYDLQWKEDGYQGEFFIAAGVSYGYARRIARNLHLEFSLGIGMLRTDYRYYHARDNYEMLLWQNNGRYTWLGPTKAKISLVWMLNRRAKTEKGGMK